MTVITGDVGVGWGVPPGSTGVGKSWVQVRPKQIANTPGGTTMLPVAFQAELATDGTFSIDVDPLPDGYPYVFEFVVDGGRYVSSAMDVLVPASGSHAFGSLVTLGGGAIVPPTWYENVLAARDEMIVSVDAQQSISGAVSLTQAATRSKYLRRRLTGNVTLTLSAGIPGQAYTCTLELQQDATGGRSLTVANARTPYGIALPLSAPANSVDLVHALWNGNTWSLFLAGTQLGIPASWVV